MGVGGRVLGRSLGRGRLIFIFHSTVGEMADFESGEWKKMELLIALIWTAGALGVGSILHLASLRSKKSAVQGRRAMDGKNKVKTQGGILALLVG